MFEKEAEVYTSRNWDKNVTELKSDTTYQYVKGSPHFYDSAIRQAYQKGAEFGYNKAKEEMQGQIEKMKCCSNCAEYDKDDWYNDNLSSKACDNCENQCNWKLKE